VTCNATVAGIRYTPLYTISAAVVTISNAWLAALFAP
jgi:hypothetical protein